MNYHKLLLITLSNIIISSTVYFESDPFYLFYYENEMFNQKNQITSLHIRPVYKKFSETKTKLTYNSWYYYNDNVPNLENMSNKWVSKGNNLFNSVHFDYFNDFIYFSLEPFLLISENLNFDLVHTDPVFQSLNDRPSHTEKPYISYGLRESHLIIHKKDIGIGLSNANMWWGPGLHSALNMSNNTTGFDYFFLGTTSEKKIGSIGYNIKYFFSKLTKNIAKPYFTGLTTDLTYYSNPIITLGFFRSFISGGTISDEDVDMIDAMLLPLQSFFKKALKEQNNNENPSDDIDQTASFFISALFPESKFKLFLEYGWNDHRWDMYDLIQHPEHSAASIMGFRKYGLFNNKNLIIGAEYTNLIKSRFQNRSNGNWYDKIVFDYSLYDGRRWTAHSGSDSDDLFIYFGYLSNENDLILSFNYERHGVVESVLISQETDLFHIPEVKLELKLDARKKIKQNEYYFFYEFEYLDDVGIVHQGIDRHFELPGRKANVFGIGFKRNLK